MPGIRIKGYEGRSGSFGENPPGVNLGIGGDVLVISVVDGTTKILFQDPKAFEMADESLKKIQRKSVRGIASMAIDSDDLGEVFSGSFESGPTDTIANIIATIGWVTLGLIEG